LNQVIHRAQRDPRHQNSVRHARVQIVEAPEGSTVPVTRRTHQSRVFGHFGLGSFPHNPIIPVRREQVNSVFWPRGHAHMIPTPNIDVSRPKSVNIRREVRAKRRSLTVEDEGSGFESTSPFLPSRGSFAESY